MKRSVKILWRIFFGGFILVILLFALANFGVFGKMPSVAELQNPEADLASEIYSGDGILMGKYYTENRSEVKYNEISLNAINALIATEDERFYDHSGIDAKAFARAVFTLGADGGGSTITQQVAKLMLGQGRGNIIKRGFQKVAITLKPNSTPDFYHILPNLCTWLIRRKKQVSQAQPGKTPLPSARRRAQHISLGLPEQRLEQGWREVPLHRDGVEILVQIGHHTVQDELPAAQLVLHHHRGQQRHAFGIASQQAQQRHVVDFGAQPVADAQLLAHKVESRANLVVAPGQQQGHFGQLGRKSERAALGPRLAHQADGLARDALAAPGVVAAGLHPLVGEDQVQRVHAQPRQQVCQAARVQHQLDIGALEQGPQEVLLEVA